MTGAVFNSGRVCRLPEQIWTWFPPDEMKTSMKKIIGITVAGLLILAGWVLHSRHEQASQERTRQEQARQEADAKAYFNEEETFQLPAVNGANTSFKDVEKSFRDYCSQNNQSVSVKSIEMAFTSQELTHQVDNRVSGEDVGQAMANGEVITRKDVRDINRFNSYVGGPRTVSDGGDLSFGVNVTITHKVRSPAGSKASLSVEWLCADPTAASRLPMHPSDDLPTLAITKYGIQFTHTNMIFDGNYQLFEVAGLLGTNTFDVKLLSWADFLRLPASVQSTSYFQRTEFPSLDNPVAYLQWNGTDVFSLHNLLWNSGDLGNLNNPVLNQSEIKVLATWAQDYYSQKLAAEKGEPIEGTGNVFKSGFGSIRIKMADGHYFDLLGPFQLLKPFFYNQAFKEVTCTVKGVNGG